MSIPRKYKFEATADLAEAKARADTQTRSVVRSASARAAANLPALPGRRVRRPPRHPAAPAQSRKGPLVGAMVTVAVQTLGSGDSGANTAPHGFSVQFRFVVLAPAADRLLGFGPDNPVQRFHQPRVGMFLRRAGLL